MVSGAIPPRSMAPRAATAPRSMAETEARAPPGSPSPRLPPIHSAIGVRAPETMTMSGSVLSDKGLLLAVQALLQTPVNGRRPLMEAGTAGTYQAPAARSTAG